MKAKLKKYISIAAFLAAGVFYGKAQSLEILGFTNNERASQIKAKVDLGEKSLAGVKTYSYDMTNGASYTSTDYSIVDNTYLSANVDCHSGAYEFFRIELTFNDDSVYRSECVNKDMTQAFYWLGDFKWKSAESGWDSSHPPRVDSSMESGINIKVNDVVYYKGISNHAPGYIEYDLNALGLTLPKSYSGLGNLIAFYGVQDPQYYGNLILEIKTDGTTQLSEHCYALTNPDRPANVPVVREMDIPLQGVSTLRIEAQSNGNNWGDHAEMPMARVYLNRSSWPQAGKANITFSTTGGEISKITPLKAALTNASGDVYFRIVSGGNLATINANNELVPVWGGKGEVVVEACYYGDGDTQPASDYAIFYVDMRPVVNILNIYEAATDEVKPIGFIYIDPKGAVVENLKLEIFDNVRTLKSLGSLYPSSSGGMPQTIPFNLPAGADQNSVLRLTYKFASAKEVTTPYWQNGEFFDYMSDLSARLSTGWGTATTNKPYGDNQTLSIGTSPTVYAKGFGFHATGYAESNIDLSPYYRFAADIGGHTITNKTRDARIHFTLQNGATSLCDTIATWQTVLDWDFPINNKQTVKLSASKSPEGDNTNNVVAIGAPRFYYMPEGKQIHEIVWDSEMALHEYKSVTIPLEAMASSGLDISYRIVKGNDLASISGNNLVINDLDDGSRREIIVEAYQAGNDIFGAAEACRKVFRVISGLEVGRDETVSLKGNHSFDELIVHADRNSSGQVDVKNGVVNVNKLILKYTFVPGEWNFIAFPAGADIEKISDFADLGFAYNSPVGPTYYIEKYDTKDRADGSDKVAWTSLDSPIVEGMKGYAVAIGGTDSLEPVEVTFTFDNLGLDLSTFSQDFNIALNLTDKSAGSTTKVTVRPVNAKGNDLNVDVELTTAATAKLPINYERALSEARFTFAGNGKQAIRFTLPDQTPARVVFFDKGGKNMVKAVKYISPMAIDVSDLKPGSYNVVVSYGNAVRTFEINL